VSRVLKRPQAEADLLEIGLHIADQDLDASDRFLDLLERKLHLLASRPQMGRLRPELLTRLRSFPVGEYVIFYRPIRNGIEVVRVLNGARDIGRLF